MGVVVELGYYGIIVYETTMEIVLMVPIKGYVNIASPLVAKNKVEVPQLKFQKPVLGNLFVLCLR